MRRSVLESMLLLGVALVPLAGFGAHVFGWMAAASPAVSVSDAESVSAHERLKSLAWLEGTWHGKVGGSDYEAVYSSPKGGTIVSASKQSQGDRTQMFDFETFEVRGSDIFMTPYPGGKKSVSFRLEGHDPAKQSAKFVNADHDFPKALLYERVGEDRLQISLFGDGPSAAVTFDLGSGKKLRR